MTTDEFIEKAKGADGAWIEAKAIGGGSHALRWHNGRLYHLSLVDGVSQRESIRYFRLIYGRYTWKLSA